MKTEFVFVLVAIAGILLAGCAHRSRSAAAENNVALPPLAANVTELKFSEFFVTPVGPRGLALTDKLANLNGQRVRMIGYMVEREHGVPGKFLFSALPLHLHEHDSALADDLPAAIVHVSVPTCRGREVPYARGLMLLTGMLSVGHRDEPDGRTSLVRLALDPPSDFTNATTPITTVKN